MLCTVSLGITAANGIANATDLKSIGPTRAYLLTQIASVAS